MKIFLSWSGETSKSLAEKFNEWLPNVLQYVVPYFSKHDIKLGDRWAGNLEKSLDEHDFGLIFVTQSNVNAPWINFEAGALSKNLRSKLVPILWESDIAILNNSPLTQFQLAKKINKENMRNLILEINDSNEKEFKLSNEVVEKSFNKWWEELEKELKNIPSSDETNIVTKKNKDEKILFEIASKVDNLYRNQNTVSNKEILDAVDRMGKSVERISNRIRRVNGRLIRTSIVDEYSDEYSKENNDIIELEILKLRKNIEYLKTIL